MTFIPSAPTDITEQDLPLLSMNQVTLIFYTIIPSVGVLFNVLTAITLIFVRIPSSLSKMILYFQTMYDTVICVLFIFTVRLANRTWSGYSIWCVGFDGGLFITYVRMLVVCNFIALSLDRFWAVLHAQSYKINMKRNQIFCALFPIAYASSATVPEYFSIKFVHHKCINMNGGSHSYVVEIAKFVLYFAIPVITVITLNFLVIRKLQKLTITSAVDRKSKSVLSNTTDGNINVKTNSTTHTHANTTSRATESHTKCCVHSTDGALLLSTLGFTAELIVMETVSTVAFFMNIAHALDVKLWARFSMIDGFVIVCCSSLNPLLQILTMKKLHETIGELRLWLLTKCCHVLGKFKNLVHQIGQRGPAIRSQ
ncbi:hypothetical protein FBUS_07240 [Fasciolopsis buskii]|uniref:G-protein coupled receptors family 1 profile domain-containing protein n=1 Tax=Fasciolopsis buskii TaxID=27845 RepID=A0A8E0S0D2_9TREM|nr:hypothetical protein FBUS_07240 [Fasciolopsis buski]